MNKLRIILITFLSLFLIGCSVIKRNVDTTLITPNNNSFIYNGEYTVTEAYDVTDENTNSEYIESLIGEKINITEDSISILGTNTTKVKYKLKVVKKDYIISYEHNIRADRFINNKSNMDIISVIDNNTILSEFFSLENGNILMLYKSLFLILEKTSNKVNIIEGSVTGNNHENNSNYILNKDVGVMIGIKKTREVTEDGTYSKEEYRTIWISYKDGKVSEVYEKENIIFPRMNGIWKLSNKEINTYNRHYEYFEVSPLEGQITSSVELPKGNSYKSIKFIGNDYIAIEKYEGSNFINQFNKYQIVPIDNVNSYEGITIDEILGIESKVKFEQDYKNKLISIPEQEKKMLQSDIDYSNITLDRNDGKWILKGKISSANNTDEGVDFNLSLKPNSKLVNFNSLFIPWKNLVGEFVFLKDAFTSPNNSMALIQYRSFLAIYQIEHGMLIGGPLLSIPLMENEEIIMAEWCSEDYIQQWQNAFKDGTIIEGE